MPTPKKTTGPKLPPVSDQMKAWSSALAAEVADWPQVTARNRFFGFTALYRVSRMFAALPRTRAMQTANSLVFKLKDVSSTVKKRLKSDSRVGSMQIKNVRWFTFELSSDSDLHDALNWIGIAYDSVANRRNRRSK